MQLVFPVKEIFTRLNAAATTGGLLEGLKIRTNPQKEPSSQRELPMIYPVEYADEDSPFAGAKRSTATAGDGSSSGNNLQTKATLSLMLMFSREHGFFRESDSDPYGLMEWVTMIKDVIETSLDTEEPDGSLNGSCAEPFYISVADTKASELSWSVWFDIEYYPLPFVRGTRKDLLPPD